MNMEKAEYLPTEVDVVQTANCQVFPETRTGPTRSRTEITCKSKTQLLFLMEFLVRARFPSMEMCFL